MRFSAAALLVAALVSCGRQTPPPKAEAAQATAVAPDSTREDPTRDSMAYVHENLPMFARRILSRGTYAQQYAVYIGLNPYYQRGLLDGDSIPDVAVRIIEKSTGKAGIAIIHGGDSSVHILGAGTRFGNGGDDFKWAWIWRIEPRSTRPDISPVGRELLYVEKPESAGGMIWWNGTSYVWTQHGD